MPQVLSEEILIVSASSCVPTPPLMAYGELGPEQLARLRDALSAEAAFKIVLVHHPPLREDGRPDTFRHGNRDGEALLEICEEREVDLLLCGHIHRPYHCALGRLQIHVAGSTTQDPAHRLPSYKRYRIEGGRLSQVEVRDFDPASRSFRRRVSA